MFHVKQYHGGDIMDLNQTVDNVTLSKVCSIKADADTDEKKSITLKVKFDGSTLQSVFDKAVAGAVIQWQNGPGRKGFNEWTDKQTVSIDFKAPGRTQIDPKTAMINQAKADGVDVTNKVALNAWVMEQLAQIS